MTTQKIDGLPLMLEVDGDPRPEHTSNWRAYPLHAVRAPGDSSRYLAPA